VPLSLVIPRAAIVKCDCGAYTLPMTGLHAASCLYRIRSARSMNPGRLTRARSQFVSAMCGHQPRPCLCSTGATYNSVAMRDCIVIIDPPERNAADLTFLDTSRSRSTPA